MEFYKSPISVNILYTMELPSNIRTILDKHLPDNGTSPVKIYNWLPGYVVKRDLTRITNANLLQEKINHLGLSLIKIPKKFAYKDFVISELIKGDSWFHSQKLMTIPMLRELHKLIVEGRTKYYEMISKNWVITRDGYLYIIDTNGDKSIPSTIEQRMFYEASWFLLGDTIQGGYMNRRLIHPWQRLIRGSWSKNSSYTPDVHKELVGLFTIDKRNRALVYDRYRKLACKILNREWADFFEINLIQIVW